MSDVKHWPLGQNAVRIFQDHIKYEVRPYSERGGITRERAARALERELMRQFNIAWPETKEPNHD